MLTATRCKRILVADDEPQVRGVLARLLEEEGFEVVAVAADGAEAAELALLHAPDAVLMDLRMPNLGGIEATRRIHGRQPDIRVVVLSAYEDPALKEEARSAGASMFLVKGCLASELVDALAC